MALASKEDSTMLRSAMVLCLLPLAMALAGKDEKPPRTDLYGDPLPEGAIARLGTVRMRQRGIIHDLRFLPDGKRLICAANDAVRLWDLESGQELRRFADLDKNYGYKTTLVVSPDGRHAAFACFKDPQAIFVWDVETGKEISRFADGQGALLLAFAPDS